MTTLFGEIAKVGSGFTLEFERVLDTDVEDLWSAVTDRTAQTLGGAVRLAPRLGPDGQSASWERTRGMTSRP